LSSALKSLTTREPMVHKSWTGRFRVLQLIQITGLRFSTRTDDQTTTDRGRQTQNITNGQCKWLVIVIYKKLFVSLQWEAVPEINPIDKLA